MRRYIAKVIVDGQPFDSIADAGRGSGISAGSLRWKIQHSEDDVRRFVTNEREIVIVYKGEKVPHVEPRKRETALAEEKRKPLMKKCQTVPGPTDKDVQIVEGESWGPITRAEFRSLQAALLNLKLQYRALMGEFGKLKEAVEELGRA